MRWWTVVDSLNEPAGPPNVRAFVMPGVVRLKLLGFIPCILLGADRSGGKALLELVRSRNKYGYMARTCNLLNCGRGHG